MARYEIPGRLFSSVFFKVQITRDQMRHTHEKMTYAKFEQILGCYSSTAGSGGGGDKNLNFRKKVYNFQSRESQQNTNISMWFVEILEC